MSNASVVLERLNLSSTKNSGIFNGTWKSVEQVDIDNGVMINPSTGDTILSIVVVVVVIVAVVYNKNNDNSYNNNNNNINDK